MVFMNSLRRTFRTQSTKYWSSRGAAKDRWPLKSTRSKQCREQTMRLANLVRKRHTVFMAFSPGWWNQVPTSLWDECHIYFSLPGFSEFRAGIKPPRDEFTSGKRDDSRRNREEGREWGVRGAGTGATGPAPRVLQRSTPLEGPWNGRLDRCKNNQKCL